MAAFDALQRTLAGDLFPFPDATEHSVRLAREIATSPERVTLPDGRQLGYAEAGDPDGEPLVLFHGFPSSRVFAAAFDEVAQNHGVRVLAPDRPGFGVSDPDPDRTLADWPDDVAALLDARGIDRAPVLGVSGGGPYALACAALLTDRVPRVAVACGVGPMGAVGFGARLPFLLGRYVAPGVAAYLRYEGLRARYSPEEYLADRAGAAADVDAAHWRGAAGRMLLVAGIEARRHHGNRPLVRDLHLYASDWPFDPGTIETPVGLWYGRADRIVPVEMGRYLAEAIPTAESHFYPDQAHISVVEENEPAMVEWLRG